MAINKETITSVFDEKLTLMQWLKTINKALKDAVLTGVEVRQKGNATFSFVVTFEDGTELESNEFVLAQGESINGATIRNGHLYLSLTNGDELDAGNLKPVTSFSINASQHLIVNYDDGTSQDLGSIFQGNVSIDGNLTANSIIENMGGYSFIRGESASVNYVYAGIVKNSNKLTIVEFIEITLTEQTDYIYLGDFVLPSDVYNKLDAYDIGNFTDILENKVIYAYETPENKIACDAFIEKLNTPKVRPLIYTSNLTIGTTYKVRIEATFLLSDNLAG